MPVLIKMTAAVVAFLLILISSADAVVVLYEHSNYRGYGRAYGKATPRLGSLLNDKVSSVRVTPGQVWALYQHAFYRGRWLTIERSVRNLRNIFNDKISSVRRIR